MKQFNIAFISGKFGDVDGVSLEVDKWIDILKELNHQIFTIAGRYKSPLTSIPLKNQKVIDSLSFDSKKQRYFETAVFPHLSKRPLHLTEDQQKEIVTTLQKEGAEVAEEIYEFIQERNIDVLIAENTNAMPMTLIGGMAVYRIATEKRMATIFHHHDFWWERSRFSNNKIESLLNQIMPPSDLGIEHVVISSYAAHILRSIKRVNPIIIPNCEDFSKAPVKDNYNNHFRGDMGFKEDDILVLQPTRIVPRKRIEDAVHLCGCLLKKYPEYQEKLHFIISLYQGDETNETYVENIQTLAKKNNLPLHLISDFVASSRKINDKGQRIYTNRDVLVQSDIVTYLPIWEGFGNALLEAIAAKKPIVTTTYLVYKTDISITGFHNIEIRDDYSDNGSLVIKDKVLDKIHYLLTHTKETEVMVRRNFKIAQREFGYKRLKGCIEGLLKDYGDEIRASKKRLEKSKHNYTV